MTDRVRNMLLVLGTFQVKHSGRSLGDHLLGTYELLKQWGCDEDVCMAGAMHSIFSTNAFRKSTVAPSSETLALLRELIGERAANLAWLFSKINRPRGLEDGHALDWKTKAPIDLSKDELHDLRLIEAANLIEQGCGLKLYPNIARMIPEVTV